MASAIVADEVSHGAAEAVHPPRRTLLGIQALRGVAACLVVLEHAAGAWRVQFGPDPGPASLVPHNTAAGVDIFFIISGFVMAISATGAGAPTASKFLSRRLLRIVPLYWIVTLIGTAKLIFLRYQPSLGGAGRHALPRLGFVLASFFFLPARDSAGAAIQPIVPSGWTLEFEMLFYLLFTAALALKLDPLRFLTPILLLLAAIGCFHTDAWPTITFLLNPVLLEFLAGVALAYAVNFGYRLPLLISVALGLLGTAILALIPLGVTNNSRPLKWGIPAFLIVTAVMMLEAPLARTLPAWALRLGDSSYSLYLVHLFVITAVVQALRKTHSIATSQFAMVTLCLILSILTGLLVHRSIERPLTLALAARFGMGSTAKT